MKREAILKEGIRLTTGDRDEVYGDPLVNMTHTAALWSAYLLHKVTAEDVAHMMTLVKIARSRSGDNADNYVDGAVYQAIAGEIRERTGQGERPASGEGAEC